MKPAVAFTTRDGSFWAHVRFVSERLGYSQMSRGKNRIKGMRRFAIQDLETCLRGAGLATTHVVAPDSGTATAFGGRLCKYLNYRAEVIESRVAPNLMTRSQAASLFRSLRRRLRPTCKLPLNKQRGRKRHVAYMVGIVNMLTESCLHGRPFCDEPRGMTVVTHQGRPLRTLSRWMDGAYPSIINPCAVWEVKEYYDTTTFGSRVADGVYETMLDGRELEELRLVEGRRVRHYLIVDDRYTWWDCGRSYLCRLVDLMHMRLVDEVIFGREVEVRWPEIVRSWA